MADMTNRREPIPKKRLDNDIDSPTWTVIVTRYDAEQRKEENLTYGQALAMFFVPLGPALNRHHALKIELYELGKLRARIEVVESEQEDPCG